MFALDYSSLGDIIFIGASIGDFKKIFLLPFGKNYSIIASHVRSNSGYFGIWRKKTSWRMR